MESLSELVIKGIRELRRAGAGKTTDTDLIPRRRSMEAILFGNRTKSLPDLRPMTASERNVRGIINPAFDPSLRRKEFERSAELKRALGNDADKLCEDFRKDVRRMISGGETNAMGKYTDRLDKFSRDFLELIGQ